MTEYIVKIGFWLQAYDGLTIEAGSDAEAIGKAKIAAKTAMESWTYPDHIDLEERRKGVICFVDRIDHDGRQVVAENVEFDEAHIDGPPAT